MSDKDYISRQTLLAKIFDLPKPKTDKTYWDGVDDVSDLISALPPVIPAEKVGRWIDGKCNRCGTHAPYWAMASTYYCSEYCPKCGAKMQEVQK